MHRSKSILLLSVAVALGSTTQIAPAQVSINIGPPPICPYGYFDYAPYDCAPYGYYGPDWFAGGVFIGAGPWFHGHPGFYGHVDNRYDPRRGYHGPLPARGDNAFNHFHANAALDAHGREGNPGHDGGGEHALPGYRGGAEGHGGGNHGGGDHGGGGGRR